METIEAEYKEYQEAGKKFRYVHGITKDEIIRREIIRKNNIRKSTGKFGMKNYVPDSRRRMSAASDAILFPILEGIVYN